MSTDPFWKVMSFHCVFNCSTFSQGDLRISELWVSTVKTSDSKTHKDKCLSRLQQLQQRLSLQLHQVLSCYVLLIWFEVFLTTHKWPIRANITFSTKQKWKLQKGFYICNMCCSTSIWLMWKKVDFTFTSSDEEKTQVVTWWQRHSWEFLKEGIPHRSQITETGLCAKRKRKKKGPWKPIFVIKIIQIACEGSHGYNIQSTLSVHMWRELCVSTSSSCLNAVVR